MKNIFVVFLIAICVFGLFACESQKVLSESPLETENNLQNEKAENPDKPEWTEQDIDSMFMKKKDKNWDIIDRVLITDNACGMIGAVLFRDNETETSSVAFFEDDGHYQRCGTYAKTPEEAGFAYLGNGIVTYKQTKDDGTVYNIKITAMIDGNNVNFIVEDDLTE